MNKELYLLPGHAEPTPASSRKPPLVSVRPIESDADYFERRARQEVERAGTVGKTHISAIHLELANRYSTLAAAIRETQERMD